MPAESALIEKLRAALDRAEEIARAVGQQHWAEDSAFLTDMVIPLPSQVRERPGWMPMITREDIRHMAANDPSSVLRTVAAHRKIIAVCKYAIASRDAGDGSAWNRAVDAEHILADLAAVYFPEAPDA